MPPERKGSVLTFGFLGLFDGVELAANILQPSLQLPSLLQSQLLARLPTDRLHHYTNTHTHTRSVKDKSIGSELSHSLCPLPLLAISYTTITLQQLCTIGGGVSSQQDLITLIRTWTSTELIPRCTHDHKTALHKLPRTRTEIKFKHEGQLLKSHRKVSVAFCAGSWWRSSRVHAA